MAIRLPDAGARPDAEPQKTARGEDSLKKEEETRRMGSHFGTLQLAASCCFVSLLAIAAPAHAEDSQNSKGQHGMAAPDRAEFDTDGDGKISAAERTAAREAHQAKRLAKFDADGDGKLSPTEENAARKWEHERRVQALDKDNDGQISEEERSAARKGRNQQRIEQFDSNGDGKVTGEELERAKAARKPNHPQKGRGPGDRPAVDQPGHAPEEP